MGEDTWMAIKEQLDRLDVASAPVAVPVADQAVGEAVLPYAPEVPGATANRYNVIAATAGGLQDVTELRAVAAAVVRVAAERGIRRLAFPTLGTGRGPFSEADDRTLLLTHAVDVVVAKNSGGAATYGKIAAARTLGVPVVLLRRPSLPEVPTVGTLDAAVAWLDHGSVLRGV